MPGSQRAVSDPHPDRCGGEAFSARACAVAWLRGRDGTRGGANDHGCLRCCHPPRTTPPPAPVFGCTHAAVACPAAPKAPRSPRNLAAHPRLVVQDISLDGEAINVAAAAVAADDTAGYTTQPWHKDYLHVKALVESASPPAVTYAAFRAAGAAGATEEGAAGRGAKRQKPNPSTEVGEDAGKSTRPAFHRGNVELVTADGSFFSIPRGDCKVRARMCVLGLGVPPCLDLVASAVAPRQPICVC